MRRLRIDNFVNFCNMTKMMKMMALTGHRSTRMVKVL